MDGEKLRKWGQLLLFSSSSPSLERMFSICFVSMKKFGTSNPTAKFCFVSWTTQDCWQVFRDNNGKDFRLKKEEEEEAEGWVYYSHKGSSTSGRLLLLLGVCISSSIRFMKFGILNGSCISIGFMKLVVVLLHHQHVPFPSKKILHSIPFCRTSHVQYFLESLALCVALSLTLAHVHFCTSHWKDVLVSFLLLGLPFFFEAMPFLHFLFLIKWE